MSSLDNIDCYLPLFAEFGIDISMITEENYAEQPFTLATLDGKLEEELQKDADHQFEQWIVRDRAYEAFGLMESDGPNIGLNGKLDSYSSKAHQPDGAFINLVKANVNRMVSRLELSNSECRARSHDPSQQKPAKAFNDKARQIKNNTNFSSAWRKYLRDGVTFGNGFIKIDYGSQRDSQQISKFKDIIGQDKPMSLYRLNEFKKHLKGHRIEYVPTFQMIHYRGARGEAASSIHSSPHRWLHRVRQISLTEAGNRFPEWKGKMAPAQSRVFVDTNPYSYLATRNTIDDTITLKQTYIRFWLTGFQGVPLTDGDTQIVPIRRYAIGKIERLEGIGVVNVDIDEYDHNMYPFINWVYFPSHRHSCGIGMVKDGRDPMVIHNRLHNGMLDYFGRQVKGGGFVDERLGLTEEQLNKRTHTGNYIPIKIPDELRDKTINDLVVDNRPPTFPAVYADLMAIEANAIDESMNVPNVSKGIQSGSSGLQEQILQNQADIAHSTTVSALRDCLVPMGKILFGNIQQFNRTAESFFLEDEIKGERQQVHLNTPRGWYMKFEPQNPAANRQGYVIIPSYIENDIRYLNYHIEITRQSIVPHKPAQRAAFYTKFFEQTAAYIGNPIAREWLKGLNKYGFQLEGITQTLANIDKMEAKAQQGIQSQQARQQQIENAKDLQELQIKQEKVNTDKQGQQQDFMVDLLKLLNDVKKTQAEVTKQLSDMNQASNQ